MAQGNPNPSPLTRFKPDQSGNPIGKTSAQKKMEMANAVRATKLRERLLIALADKLDEAELIGNAAENIQADILKLIKDSEDRGLGTPTSKQELTGKDGEPLRTGPTIIRIVAAIT